MKIKRRSIFNMRIDPGFLRKYIDFCESRSFNISGRVRMYMMSDLNAWRKSQLKLGVAPRPLNKDDYEDGYGN